MKHDDHRPSMPSHALRTTRIAETFDSELAPRSAPIAARLAGVELPSPAAAGAKHDSGKLPLDLLPFDALEEVSRVLQFGAAKYARRNWEKGIQWSRLGGAVLRHTFAWMRGEDRDPETGLSHMAHAACECLFVLAFELRDRRDLDDRDA